MRNQNQRYVEAMQRATVEVVHIVRIYPGGGGKTDDSSVAFVRADRPLFGLENAIASIEPYAAELHPFTRATSVGSVEITFAGSVGANVFRDLAVTKPLKCKYVVITEGTPDLDPAEFDPFFFGVIDDFIPDEGPVTLRARTLNAVLEETDITGAWIGKHPRTIVADIYNRAGVPVALVPGTFDPYQAGPARHWNMTRATIGKSVSFIGTDRAIVDPTKALGLVNELLEITGDAIVEDPAGLARYAAFDPNSRPVRSFTAEDIGRFTQLGTIENLCNVFSVGFLDNAERQPSTRAAPHGRVMTWGADSYGGPSQLMWAATDEAAQEEQGFPGQGPRELVKGMVSDWLNSESNILDSGDPDVIRVYGATLLGFTGARLSEDGLTLLSPLDDNHVAYLRVRDELIECNRSSITGAPLITDVDNAPVDGEHYVPTEDARIGPIAPMWVDYTISRRAVLGTLEASLGYFDPVSDYTLAVNKAAGIIQRFSHGAPVVEITVNLTHSDIEVSDFVTCVDDVYLNYRADGCDARTVWEVISVSREPYSEPPQIVLQLCRVRTDEVPQGWRELAPRTEMKRRRLDLLGMRETFGNRHFVSGGEFDAGGGLSGTIGSALMATHSQEFESPEITFNAFNGNSLTASRDHWFSFDALTGGLIRREEALGSSEPDWEIFELPCCKVVTSGVGVSSSEDLRQLYAFDGSKIAPGTVGGGAVADHSIGWQQVVYDYAVPVGEIGLNMLVEAAAGSGEARLFNIAALEPKGLELTDTAEDTFAWGVYDQTVRSVFRKIHVGAVPPDIFTAPTAGEIAGAEPLAGSTDQPSAGLVLTSGRSTGLAPGEPVRIQVAPAGLTGTTPNDPIDAFIVWSRELQEHKGNVKMPATFWLGFSGAISGSNACALHNSSATGDYAWAMGWGAGANYDDSQAWGADAQANGPRAVVSGNAASGGDESAVYGTSAGGSYAGIVCVGFEAAPLDEYTTQVGWKATATGVGGSSFGASSESDELGVALGGLSVAGVSGSACGYEAEATGEGSSAFGAAAIASGEAAGAFAAGATASAYESLALGPSTDAAHAGAIALGPRAATEKANQLVVGASASPIVEESKPRAWTSAQDRECRVQVTTTDATPTTVHTFAAPDDAIIFLEADFLARQSTGTNRAVFQMREAFYRQSGGAPTAFPLGLVSEWADGTATALSDWIGGWNVSGNDITTDVVGKGGMTVYWTVTLRIRVVSTNT